MSQNTVPMVLAVIYRLIYNVNTQLNERGIYYGLFTLTHRVFLPLILSVVVGVFVYFVMIMYIYWEHPAYLFEIPYMKTLYYKIKRIMKK